MEEGRSKIVQNQFLAKNDQSLQGIDAVLPRLPDHLLTNVSDSKIGRFAKVLLSPILAIKIQKVYLDHGLKTLEWRGETHVSLNATQEIVSAKAFGNMAVGPKVYAVMLVKHIPKALEEDNGNKITAKIQGKELPKDICWNLVIVMQRMTGSIRVLQVLPPQAQAIFWKRLNITRVVYMIKILSKLGYDHNDIRHDNIGFVEEDKDGGGDNGLNIDLYLLDYGYGKLLRHRNKHLTNKICDAICAALESVGAPSIVRRTIVMEVRNSEKI